MAWVWGRRRLLRAVDGLLDREIPPEQADVLEALEPHLADLDRRLGEHEGDVRATLEPFRSQLKNQGHEARILWFVAMVIAVVIAADFGGTRSETTTTTAAPSVDPSLTITSVGREIRVTEGTGALTTGSGDALRMTRRMDRVLTAEFDGVPGL